MLFSFVSKDHILNKRPKDVLRPLFPGYLFVSMGRDTKNIRAINGTRGVKHLISSGSWPSPLPNGFVDAMLKHANDDGTISLLPSLSVGDRVEIVTGPFAKKIGEIIAMNDSGRITILMELLSGSVRVSTKASALLPI